MCCVANVDVSIVIPAYNEARRLPATLHGWREFLSTLSSNWEIVVVDDGSRDDTTDVARAAGARALRLDQNQGKGGAVRTGMLAASGEVIAYVDADMNVAPTHLPRALEMIESGAELVVGRRELSSYASDEGLARVLAGGLVQITRRLLVLRGIRDTQCGFKVFRRALARDVFSRTRIRSFAFDIEVLFLAQQSGARIEQMPVRADYRGESTFNVRKHLPVFLRDIVQIRRNALAGVYDKSASVAESGWPPK
jgi:glycosyltransferase involved in cell wall biosynthesis